VIEKIAKYAKLILRLCESHDPEGKKSNSPDRKLRDIFASWRTQFIVVFVKEGIMRLLEKNYRVLDDLQVADNSDAWAKGAKTYPYDHATWARLYPDPDESPGQEPPRKLYPVGPLGERPIHVCALLSARYRSEDGCGFIADGINKGMRAFLKSANNRAAVAFECYGKHYSAAVGCYIAHRGLSLAKEGSGGPGLPFYDTIHRWYRQQLSPDAGPLGLCFWKADARPLEAADSSIPLPVGAQPQLIARSRPMDRTSYPSEHLSLISIFVSMQFKSRTVCIYMCIWWYR
jgi:hypothetical protein